MNQTETPWVDGRTIGQVLQHTTDRYPDQLALIFPQQDVLWSWREFTAAVEQTAAALWQAGIRPGQHVGVWATNVPQWVVLQFATAHLGAVLVTINPAYRSAELSYVLGQSEIVALFLIDRFKSSDYFEILTSVCPELAQSDKGKLQCSQFPNLKTVVAIQGEPRRGMLTWQEFLEQAGQSAASSVASAAAECKATDPINIQYTSGTTGFPKAATLSHRNILLNAYYVGRCQQLTQTDRICIPVPFYHCFGCVLGTLCATVCGAGMVIPAESFSASATLDAMQRYGATVVYGVPTMFIAQLEHPSFANRNLSTLRTGIMAGSPCPIEIMRRVVSEMGVEQITIAYGLTEASPVITQTNVGDDVELRVCTVGRPIPGVEVRIVDPATGEVLPDNQQGELQARGHVVMLGYYNDPDATAAAIDPDGWLHTGDLAVRLDSGYYRITGRIKDMVIRGGENIYPREIEEQLFAHPAVEQVAVVGVPDEKYGEELCAWVKLKSGSATSEVQLREFCRSRLAHFKVPRYVKLVETFPQTVTGKIQKFKIREMMADELGLQQEETA